MSDPQTQVRRRRWILIAGAAAVAVLISSSIGIVRYLSSPLDMAGNHVAYEDFSPPSAEESEAVEQVGTDRFIVDSVGLNVPMGSLKTVRNVIEPPGFTSAYWVRDHGVAPVDGAKGTVFVVMHSLRAGGKGPGNSLIDVKNASSKVGLGAKIVVDDTSYTVTGTQTIDKPAVAEASAVWADVPGRLVVITCLQKPNGSASTKNVIIEAQMDAPLEEVPVSP
ncbi:class F sortase [Clavibacter michiganensis]|uniref:class F sortase n=1 Tax=Clavibacter michiganensis TaxID=28447 RepID=UPI0011B07091|nr:class F sortase [Clavibacter michiganensis]